MQNIEPKTHLQQSHTTYINIVCFFLMLAFGFTGGLLPMFCYWQNISWDLANASFITGCVLSSVQLADKKWLIPSAGFVLISIAFIGFFTLIPCDTPEKIQEVAKNVILIIPSMIMISSYRPFPVWVRWFGFFACIPYIMILVMAKSELKQEYFVVLLGVGYFLIEVTAVCWGIYFLRILRAERKR